jgi:Domain of unknown function (DUF4287)
MPDTPKGPASYFPSIETKYGRPIAEWLEALHTSGIDKHMEMVAWLKAEHAMGHATPTPSWPTTGPTARTRPRDAARPRARTAPATCPAYAFAR